jgi:hypothetical protein
MPAHKEANIYINRMKDINRQAYAKSYWRFVMGYITICPSDIEIKGAGEIRARLDDYAAI